MKRKLGILSKKYHKNNIPLVDLLPEIIKIFDEIKTKHDCNICEYLNNIINITVNDWNFTRDIYMWSKENGYLTEQILTATIRSLSMTNDIIDEALDIISTSIKDGIYPHARTFIFLLNDNNNNNNNKFDTKNYDRLLKCIEHSHIVFTDELYSLLIKNAPHSSYISNLIKCAGLNATILNDNVIESESFTTSKLVSVNEDGICDGCKTKLTLTSLNEIRDVMLGKVFDNQDSDHSSDHGIIRWVQNRKYDIVIDGANVAHYNNSPFDSTKVIKMINHINNNYNDKKILVVFNACRKKLTKHLVNMWVNVDIFYTKRGTNDDLSWLYASIYYSSWCITNDQLRDHIYYRFRESLGDWVNIWIEQHVINFEVFFDKDIKLYLPLVYSIRSQIKDNNIHIPLKDGWCCATI